MKFRWCSFVVSLLIAAPTLCADPSLDTIAQVLDSRNIEYVRNFDDIRVDDFGVDYRVEERTLIVESLWDLEFAKDYAIPVISSLELLVDARDQFVGAEYVATAANRFDYTRYGIEWAPQIIEGESPAGVTLARVNEPETRGWKEFAWLVPEQGDEVPSRYRWTIPKSVARNLPEPLGYEWKYNNWLTRVPEGYEWYVPPDWPENNSEKWVAPALRYRLPVNDVFLDHYASLQTDLEKIERVRELMVQSFNSQFVEVVP